MPEISPDWYVAKTSIWADLLNQADPCIHVPRAVHQESPTAHREAETAKAHRG